MSLAFSVLASGSAGNCTMLVYGGESGQQPGPESGPESGQRRVILIDAGLSPRATLAHLAVHGYDVTSIDAILLTHLDGDHFHGGWVRVIEEHDLRVFVHRRHRNRAAHAGVTGRALEMFDADFRIKDVTVAPHLVAHDALGTVSFRFEYAGARLGWATDLGRVPRSLTQHLAGIHALAIESNYDPAMQRRSHRPDFLKRRIMGGRGHLSNEQSLAAIIEIAATSRLEHVVPLHLSRQCNEPRLVRDLIAQRAPDIAPRLTITSQRTPTPLLRVRGGGVGAAPGRQFELAW